MNTNIDSLIEKTNSLIENLDKYVSGLTNQQISIVDLLTLISAILAVILSGVSIFLNFRSDKKNRESNEKIAKQIQDAENKRAEATIDANLTANARIEWIQNVRKATAELIAACYKYIGSKPEELQKNWETVEEKKALFVLYFGPDDDNSNEIRANNLHDKNTNKGKNDQLVLFVDELCSNLRMYHLNHDYLDSSEKEKKECNGCLYEENGEVKIMPKCPKDEYGTLFDEEDCKRRKNYLEEKIKRYYDFEKDIFIRLRDLSEIMRIYEKIEWKRAKKVKSLS